MADNSRDEEELRAKREQEREAFNAQIRDQLIAAERNAAQKDPKKAEITEGVRPQDYSPERRQGQGWEQYRDGMQLRGTRELRQIPKGDIERLLRQDGIGENGTTRFTGPTAPTDGKPLNLPEGQRLQIVMVGPDENGAFTKAYENLRNQPNVVFYNMEGRTAAQQTADIAAIKAKYGVQQYDAVYMAHGFQGRDGQKGGFQIGTKANGNAATMSWDAGLSVHKEGARNIVILSCEGGAAIHSAHHAPTGAVVMSVASESTVGWSDNIARATNYRDGEYVSAAGIYAKGVDAVNLTQIAARNRYHGTDKEARYYNIASGTKGAQIFARNPEELLAKGIGIGQGTALGQTPERNANQDIETLVDSRFAGFEAHKEQAIQALPASMRAKAERVYSAIQDGRKFDQFTGDDRNIVNVLTTQLVVEKENARQEAARAKVVDRTGAPLPAAVLDEAKAARSKTQLDAPNDGKVDGEPNGHIVNGDPKPKQHEL